MTFIFEIKTLSTSRVSNYLVKDSEQLDLPLLPFVWSPAHLFTKFSPQIKSEGIELDGIVLKGRN